MRIEKPTIFSQLRRPWSYSYGNMAGIAIVSMSNMVETTDIAMVYRTGV